MVPNGLNVSDARCQRDPSADRAVLVFCQQQPNLFLNGIVGAFTTHSNAVAVVISLGAINGNRHAYIMRSEVIDGFFIQQRGVGSQGKIHPSSQRAKALLAVGDDLLDQGQV